MGQKILILSVLIMVLCIAPSGFCAEVLIEDSSTSVTSTGEGGPVEAHVTATADTTSGSIEVYASGSAENGSFTAEATGSATVSNELGTASVDGLAQASGESTQGDTSNAEVTTTASFTADPQENFFDSTAKVEVSHLFFAETNAGIAEASGSGDASVNVDLSEEELIRQLHASTTDYDFHAYAEAESYEYEYSGSSTTTSPLGSSFVESNGALNAWVELLEGVNLDGGLQQYSAGRIQSSHHPPEGSNAALLLSYGRFSAHAGADGLAEGRFDMEKFPDLDPPQDLWFVELQTKQKGLSTSVEGWAEPLVASSGEPRFASVQATSFNNIGAQAFSVDFKSWGGIGGGNLVSFRGSFESNDGDEADDVYVHAQISQAPSRVGCLPGSSGQSSFMANVYTGILPTKVSGFVSPASLSDTLWNSTASGGDGTVADAVGTSTGFSFTAWNWLDFFDPKGKIEVDVGARAYWPGPGPLDFVVTENTSTFSPILATVEAGPGLHLFTETGFGSATGHATGIPGDLSASLLLQDFYARGDWVDLEGTPKVIVDPTGLQYKALSELIVKTAFPTGPLPDP